MRRIDRIKKKMPTSVKGITRPVYLALGNKYRSEFSFWQGMWNERHAFDNQHFEELYLAIAGEPNVAFIEDRIIADFGCGPRGTLAWARAARLRIGIDVLADRYAESFKNDFVSHGMIYLKSTEQVIPLPSDSIDVLFTVNAMDHVDDFESMCREIVRIMKPGALFIGSVSVGKPPTPTEPQTLSEDKVHRYLLDMLEMESYRRANRGPEEDKYVGFSLDKPDCDPTREIILWIRARKRP